MSKQKLIILFTVLIDVIGVGIVIPILPFYVKAFGAPPWVITLLFSAFSFCAFFSAPFLGSLSDKIGRRIVLLVSIFSTSLGWLVFAFAPNILFLFFGRIIDGLAAGNFSTAQSCFVDLAKDKKERAASLGILGAVFGIGFIIGPMLGGLLSSFSHRTPFIFVGILALANFLLALIFLPETLEKKQKDKKINFNPFLPFKNAFRKKSLGSIFSAWFLFGLTMATMQAILALYLAKVFRWQASQVSFLIVAFGLILAFNQGVALKHFWLKKFAESDLIMAMFVISCFCYLLMAKSILSLFLVAVFVGAFSESVLRVVLTSRAVGLAGEEKRGETLGVLSSIISLAMILGPILSGFLFQIKSDLPFWASAFYGFLALLIMFFFFKRNKRRKKRLALRAE